jgi:hypothetical protein
MNPLRLLNTKPAYIWIGFYLAINIVACFLILNDGRLLGETANIDLHENTPVVLICCVVLLTYILPLGSVFNRLYKLPAAFAPSVPTTQNSGRDIGMILLVLQVGFILFILTEGVFIAGSNERSTSLWSQFFVLFSSDTLFLLYYAFYRDSKLYMPNLVAVIISSLLRGWIGIFMTLVLLESMRLIRRREISMAKIGVAATLILVMFPFLQILKLEIRASAMGVSLDYANLITSLSSSFELENFINVFYGAFQLFVDRLQILSQYIVVFQNAGSLSEQYQSGNILPYWLDGIHGVAYYRLLGDAMPDNLGVHLAKLLDPLNTDVNWNSNPGLLAWVMINPLVSIAYGSYLFFIVYCTLIFIKSLRHGQAEVRDVIWFSWLAYLIPGWTGSLFLFLHTAVVFYFMHLIRRMFVSRRKYYSIVISDSASQIHTSLSSGMTMISFFKYH